MAGLLAASGGGACVGVFYVLSDYGDEMSEGGKHEGMPGSSGWRCGKSEGGGFHDRRKGYGGAVGGGDNQSGGGDCGGKYFGRKHCPSVLHASGGPCGGICL